MAGLEARCIRVVVTGAAGQIAYALLPSLCNGAIFGEQARVTLHLLDIPGTESVLQGLCMELEDSALPYLQGLVSTTSATIAFASADYAILVGGFPRKPGMERKELLARNVEIMRAHGSALNEHASRDVRVVVVANPANTNCLVCMRSAPDIPRENFTCLTRLDHNRLRAMLAKRISSQRGPGDEVLPTQIRNVLIWGNHSSTQVPSAQHAEVDVGEGHWVSVPKLLADDAWLAGPLVEGVQQRGAAVLAARKLSSAMSAARAVGNHLSDWVRGTAPGEFVSMGVLAGPNEYGVPAELVFSMPVVCENGRWRVYQGLELSDTTRRLLPFTIKELEEEKAGALGLSNL